ncbi:MAG: hypothetical protein H6502_00980 [Candidatus Woesearchaeota archaeon]|nr:MAG: hypothetical protein H6502_00980 [Candidatus Woesearchaeota archaeon]
MKQVIMLMTLVVVLLSYGVIASQGDQHRTDPDISFIAVLDDVASTQSTTGTLTITTTGEATFIVTLSAGTLEGACTISDISLSQEEFTFVNASTEEVNISVSLPACAARGNYTGHLYADVDITTNETGYIYTDNISVTLEVLNRAPVIQAIADITNQSGSAFSMQVEASDVDGDDLTYSLSGTTALSINQEGLLVGTVPEGATTIEVQVSDGTVSVSDTFVLTGTYQGKRLQTSTATLFVGGPSQDRETNLSFSFTLSNTGTETITNLLYGNNIDSEYAFAFTSGPSSLAPGAQALVTGYIYIPDSKDSEREQIGIIAIGDETSILVTLPVDMQAVSEAEIKKLKVETSLEEDTSVQDDEKVKARIGDEVTVTITVKNKFNENIDFEDITITLISEDLNDLDEEDSFGDTIRDGKDETFTMTFDIDEDQNDGENRVTVLVEAEDENGAIHTVEQDFIIDINQEDEDYRIDGFTLTPLTVQCGGTMTVRADIDNIGADDVDRGMVIFSVADLNIERVNNDVSIDFDDSDTITFSVPIPANAAPGSYLAEVSAYIGLDRDDDLTDSEATQFIVTCNDDQTSTNNNNNQQTQGNTGNSGIVLLDQDNEALQELVGVSATGTERKDASSGIDTTEVILFALVVLMIIVILLLAVNLMRQKK